MAAPDITLYTSFMCPWAHRAQIALKELDLPFKTEEIDLRVPRTPEYLAINPRGLVPSLSYDGAIITESAVVSQFLADAHPSHLLKASTAPGGPLQRARIAFFVDTFFDKVNSSSYALLRLEPGPEQDEQIDVFVAAITKHLDPLLADAAPFFGGADKFTMAEVLTGSFVVRTLVLAKHDVPLPKSTLTKLAERAPNYWRWAQAVVQNESLRWKFDEDKVAVQSAARVGKTLTL